MEAIRRARSTVEAIHPVFASEAFWQLVRFAVAGLCLTVFSVTIYSAGVTVAHLPPLVANGLSWVCGVSVGYAIHSRWSFASQKEAAESSTVVRFLLVYVFALGLNSFWVWLAIHYLQLPPLAPVPAMVFVTPLASFLLNRYWVFEAA
jgi:putative flippase GtrA